MDNICSECRNFKFIAQRKGEGLRGQCRKAPPSLGQEGEAVYPVVPFNAWCSYFKASGVLA